MESTNIQLTEQEVEVLQKELGYILETEMRSVVTKVIINNILKKLENYNANIK